MVDMSIVGCMQLLVLTSGDQGSRKLVIVCPIPCVVPSACPNDGGGVRDSSADDDVRIGLQGLDDSPGSNVCDRADRLMWPIAQSLVWVIEVRHIP